MSAEQCSAAVGVGGGVPRLEGGVPPPRPTVLESRNSGAQHDPQATTVASERTVLDERGCRSMAKQFKSKQVLSTFHCTLIIAYIAFATHVEKRNLAGGIPYNFGILFALLAIIAHGSSIILSSQRIALCNDFSMERTKEDLRYSLAVCGVLQFSGTTLFVMAVTGSIFLFFDHILYVVLFFVVSLGGLIAFVYGNGELARVQENIYVIRTPMRVPRNPEA